MRDLLPHIPRINRLSRWPGSARSSVTTAAPRPARFVQTYTRSISHQTEGRGPKMDDGLLFDLLGPVRAWRGEAEIDLGTPQQRAVLGLLLLRAGAVVTTDQLITAVWGENAPQAAGGMVRTYVSRLRRVLRERLAAPLITSVAGGYLLSLGSGSLDVASFEHGVSSARRARHVGDVETEARELRAALALWKGAPLGGVRGEYAHHERSRLIGLQLSAIEDLASVDLELGNHVEAGSALVRVVIEEPLRERPRELLMLALYRAGRKAEALALYQETQQLLANELGLDPGPELQEMQRRILTSDPSLAKPALARPLVPGSPESRQQEVASPTGGTSPSGETADEPATQIMAAPMQLPPRLPQFSGRSAELARLTGLLRSDTQVPVLGIAGLAGIGKTALAIQLGHGVADHFPDGLLFVDCGSAEDPLATVLRACGQSSLPATVHERATEWRRLSNRRRILLVLDNALDTELVRSLLPGSSSALVLTSQQQLFGLAHAQWTTLAPLPESESLELLMRKVGRARVEAEPTAARLLVELTSGVPQAIDAVGARLASRPGWTLDTAVKRLRAPRYPLEPRYEECRVIQAPYDAAVRSLSSAQARALRLLAVPSGPDISLAAAAALLDLSPDETDYLLESLADLHLIEPTRGRGHYTFLNPVQQFARARALLEEGQAECQTALARLARFYVASLNNALSMIDPGRACWDVEPDGEIFADPETARDWLQDQQQHLWEAASSSADIGDAPTEELVRLIDQAHPWPDPATEREAG
jgi:DNA-binding SARP family transcriptional activator